MSAKFDYFRKGVSSSRTTSTESMVKRLNEQLSALESSDMQNSAIYKEIKETFSKKYLIGERDISGKTSAKDKFRISRSPKLLENKEFKEDVKKVFEYERESRTLERVRYTESIVKNFENKNIDLTPFYTNAKFNITKFLNFLQWKDEKLKAGKNKSFDSNQLVAIFKAIVVDKTENKQDISVSNLYDQLKSYEKANKSSYTTAKGIKFIKELMKGE